MSAQLPCPSASTGAASGRAVIRGKIEIATQRQREQAMLLTQVDKSREPAIDKTRAFNRAAPAMPSSVERTHRLPQGGTESSFSQELLNSDSYCWRRTGNNYSVYNVYKIWKIRQTQQNCGNSHESKVLVDHFWICQNIFCFGRSGASENFSTKSGFFNSHEQKPR